MRAGRALSDDCRNGGNAELRCPEAENSYGGSWCITAKRVNCLKGERSESVATVDGGTSRGIGTRGFRVASGRSAVALSTPNKFVEKETRVAVLDEAQLCGAASREAVQTTV